MHITKYATSCTQLIGRRRVLGPGTLGERRKLARKNRCWGIWESELSRFSLSDLGR